MRFLAGALVAILLASPPVYAGDDDGPEPHSTANGSQPQPLGWQRGARVDTGLKPTWRSRANTGGSHVQTFDPQAVEPSTAAPTKREYLGNLSANPYDPNSTANPYGAGSPFRADGVKNPFGTYGSPSSSKSATNPYATDAPKLYDSQGNYRGKLSANPYDPDSVSNPYGRYGSQFSSDSIHNKFGAGSPFRTDSPNNPYGSGLEIYGE